MEPQTHVRPPTASRTSSVTGSTVSAENGATANQLYAFSIACIVFSAGSALLGISYLMCPSEIAGLSLLCQDNHYKYLVPLLVPTTAWFVIANWVGWQYFRYA